MTSSLTELNRKSVPSIATSSTSATKTTTTTSRKRKLMNNSNSNDITSTTASSFSSSSLPAPDSDHSSGSVATTTLIRTMSSSRTNSATNSRTSSPSNNNNECFYRPFDIRYSTEENHRLIITSTTNNDQEVVVKENEHHHQQQLFFGAYGHLRKKLDYNYHCYYKKERQWLHDSIIEDFLEYQEEQHHNDELQQQHDEQQHQQDITKSTTHLCSSNNNENNHSHHHMKPWFILAVGIQGTGKHYTISELVKKKKLRLLSFVSIAPDDICRYLPEYSSYVDVCTPEQVDQLTRKEAGYIAETLILATLQAGRNAILHCQLRDTEWYKYYIQSFLRKQFTNLHIALMHIIADTHSIKYRLNKLQQQYKQKYNNKNKKIKRTANNNNNNSKVKEEGIDESIILTDEEIIKAGKRTTEAVAIVKSTVDYYCVIKNTDNIEPMIMMSSGNETNKKDDMDIDDWTKFQVTFDQSATADSAAIISDDSSAIPINDQYSEQHEKGNSIICNNNSIVKCRRRSATRKMFTTNISSAENFIDAVDHNFYGQFAHLREQLDYTYHSNYTKERQHFQDSIIRDFLSAAVIKDKNGEVCTTPTEPWIVFTAGAMGAGKSYTMNKLVNEGRFPLLAFIQVDPDAIRRYLPEFHLYVKENPELAGEKTRREAGFIAEILTLAGLHGGKNVMVDGSLRDAEWYEAYFKSLRKQFSNIRIAIIHVTAPREAVFERAEHRAIQTGRVVPRHILIEALEQVPKSVKRLENLVDYHVELRNTPGASNIELVSPGQTWESFSHQWIQ